MLRPTTLRIFRVAVLRFRLGRAWPDKSSECPSPPSECPERASPTGQARACTSWVVSFFGVGTLLDSPYACRLGNPGPGLQGPSCIRQDTEGEGYLFTAR